MFDWPDPRTSGVAVPEAFMVARVPPRCPSPVTEREAYLQYLDDERHRRYTSNYDYRRN